MAALRSAKSERPSASALRLWPLLAFIIATAALEVLRAQLPKGTSARGFQYVWHDPKDAKPKAFFSGATARQVTGSQLRITDFTMRILRDGRQNDVQLFASAPECLFDRAKSTASSSGPIFARSATTNLQIEGIGFFCQQSNGLMIISNAVRTVIHKSLLGGKEDAGTDSFRTNDLLRISSDRFRFLYESNLVTYSGNVRAEDDQAIITCDLLNIILTTNQSVERIIADGDVAIINRQDSSRARGNQAVYSLTGGREVIELLGEPTWSDGQREGRADKFVFDRTNNVFRAEQNAVFSLPREKIGQLDLLAPGAAPVADQTDKVTIAADLITMRRPQVEGAVTEILADKNVVIISKSDDSRATAGRARYDEATGLLTLSEAPLWNIKGNQIAAEIMTVGRTNGFFAARSNVVMTLPVALFGKLASSAGAPTNSPIFTNQIVKVQAGSFSYATNRARFRDDVRAETTDELGAKTTLMCDRLDVEFGLSNQVERVVANQKVFLQQTPPASSSVLEKSLAADHLLVERSPITGFLESIEAKREVIARQVEKKDEGKETKVVRADAVEVKFRSGTNQIDTVIARTNVIARRIISKADGEKIASARGEQAVYRAADEVVELTGRPSVTAENIMFDEASHLRWHLNTGKISGFPTAYRVRRLPSTNSSPSSDLR